MDETASADRRTASWTNIFLAVALGATAFGVLASSKTLFGLEKKIADAKASARPAALKLTIITTPSCADCFTISNAVADLKQQSVSISDERTFAFDSTEAQALIQKLGITRVPTYVVTGDIDKPSLEEFVKNNGERQGDAFVFTRVPPIFVNPATKQEVGRVKATELTDTACASCAKPELLVQSLNRAGIKLASTASYAWNSSAGQDLIRQYKITAVPAVILSSDFDAYDAVKSTWLKRIGTKETDGAFVSRKLSPPYRDVEKNQIVGLVDVIYLTDTSCKECYKPQTLHKNILTQSFGVAIRLERIVDAGGAAGKELIKTYTLTEVPTLLLSPEASKYPALVSVWPKVGSVEADGWYIFRKNAGLGTVAYRNLSSNKIIQPAQNADASSNPSP